MQAVSSYIITMIIVNIFGQAPQLNIAQSNTLPFSQGHLLASVCISNKYVLHANV